MRFNRKQLCLLADMQLEHFKTASRVGRKLNVNDLPFAADADEESSSYAKYTLSDVVKLAVAVAFTRPGGFLVAGLKFPQASLIAANAPIHLAIDHMRAGGSTYFVGYGSHNNPEDGGRNLFGSWGDVGEQLKADDHSPAYTRVLLVDVVSVIRAVAQRAIIADIDVDWSEN